MSNNNNSSNSSNSNNDKDTNTIQNKPKNGNRSKGKKFLKTFLVIILATFLIGVLTISGFVFAIIKTSPPLTIEAVTDLDQASQLFDANGEFMDEVLTAEKRYVVPLNEMPLNLRNAFIAIEDERFYEHCGVDVRRILSALLTDIKKILNKESGLHGASTITQQVIKNNILTNEVSIVRKIREMHLALELEKKMSKDQILEVYLNTIFVGGNAYGVEAGALQYFSKKSKDLTLAQCAFLAGATQHPTKYYSSAVNPEDSQFYKNRAITVLSKMLELGYISQEDHDNAVNEIASNNIGFDIKRVSDSYNYEWFSRPVVQELTNDLKKVYGYTDEEVKLHLRNDGLKIYTTMDRGLQDYAQDVLDNATNYINLKEWTDENGIVQPQMSSVVIDFKTGHVKSIIGGRGDQNANSYNRAASNDFLRSIGSTTKPLTAYAPLIDLKLGHAGTGVEDSPLSKEMSSKYGGWNPTNEVKGNFIGYTNVRYSLERSINLSSIKIVDKIGLDNALEYGEKFGLHYNNNSKHSIATLALGQFNNDPQNLDGGNPLILASAFSTFANGGVLTEPITYTHVVDKNGKVILENVPDKKQVVSPETAYIMYDLLKGPVERYSSRPAKFGNIPVAGKTGTTENNKDLWFSGVTPYMACAVWIGADKPTELKDKYGNKPFSGSTASALFGKIMAKAHESLPPIDISRPANVVSANICSVSGMLATPHCHSDPRGNKVYTELFIKGTVPTHTCDIHVPVTVNSLTGAIATANTPEYLRETRVFLNRKYTPSVYLSDQKYVVPNVYDNGEYELPEDDGINQDGVDPDESWFEENNPSTGDDTHPPISGDKNDQLNKPSDSEDTTKPDSKPSDSEDTTINPDNKPSDSEDITKPDSKPSDSEDTTINPDNKPSGSEDITKPDSKPSDSEDTTIVKPSVNPSDSENTDKKPDNKPSESGSTNVTIPDSSSSNENNTEIINKPDNSNSKNENSQSKPVEDNITNKPSSDTSNTPNTNSNSDKPSKPDINDVQNETLDTADFDFG